ncbi:MAG: asparagine synthetase B family protein, partial [Limisphaerales bacterium]
ALLSVSSNHWNALCKHTGFLMPRGSRQSHPGDKLHKLGRALKARDPEGMYRALVSSWDWPESVALGSSEPGTILTDRSQWIATEITEKMMFLDTLSYLPDDILAKTDRASMGVSLEVRVPFLDHRLVEFAWRLPLEMKIRRGSGKWLLRQVLDRYVPRNLVDRPKIGFGVPVYNWLRGPLRDWAEDLLDAGRLRREGFFNPEPVRRKWREHLSGKHNWMDSLWSVLMFQAWLANEKSAPVFSAEAQYAPL